ncbi:hypothetical protein F6X37_11230 [Paraburkholderia sp. 31.1]|uniref:hypothetical protein n=1 Tax=Paraburkholderia sp. 31.1 TaxID=2615205 RepID=UPI0016557A13|nr:hypothetical protein [Paraburkholderia sp. 31.1]MBC8722145.1 hypothetical protein [Paraburkholderia sp. 31.1]
MMDAQYQIAPALPDQLGFLIEAADFFRRMGSQIADAEHHAAVLNRVRPIRAHVRLQRQRNHFFEPVGVDDFDVVVHQADEVGRARQRDAIIQRRVVICE